LSNLEEDYLASRQLFDSQITLRDRKELNSFFDLEVIAPEETAESAVARARLDFLKVILSHLLEEKEEVIKKFRMEVSVRGMDKISYDRLFQMIFADIYPQIADQLDPATIRALHCYGLSSTNIGYEFYLLCQNYPHLKTPEVDIYSKEQVNTFYGHLLGTISGIGRPVYENYYRKWEALTKEIGEYGDPKTHLPVPSVLGS